ncbi:hypothetical protein ACLQ3K_22195 [Tsukamurella sp. DT100]|uniref:Gp37-like protein n=1 Tax=Tsukamurella sp. DT100 TaxID=3393415 RepID=UPI003CEE876C
MTAPALLEPDQVRASLLTVCADMVRQAHAPRKIWIYDKNWTERTRIFGEISGKFVHKLNDSGEGELELFGDHPIRDWVVDELGEDEDLHIVVETAGVRWSGKCTTITEEDRDNGFSYLKLAFISEFEHVKKIVTYCNPFLPAEVQWPKIWATAGPAASTSLIAIFLNLLRRFALPWTFSDNILDPGSWVANLNPENWPIIIKPIDVLQDTSMWAVMATRFGLLYDMILPTLKDAGLQLKAERWLPGDEQPAEDWYTLEKPTLVLSIENKSGYRGLTGTVLDGLAYLVLQITEDFINETAQEIQGVPNPSEYSRPGWRGSLKDFPWVNFRNIKRTHGISGVKSKATTIHKASASAVVTGGKSPQWVNSGLKLLLNATLGYLGQVIGNPNIFVDIVYPQVEDVILAFDRIPNPFRQTRMGLNGPPFGEVWEATGGTGFSLSALQSVRTGFWKSRAYTSTKVEVENGAPYLIGQHFGLGDRVATEVGRSGWYYVDQVYTIEDSWSRTQDPIFQVSIGNDHLEDTPGALLARQVANIRSVVQALGVSS